MLDCWNGWLDHPAQAQANIQNEKLQGKTREKSTKRPNKRIMMEICVFKLVDKAHAEEAQAAAQKASMQVTNQTNKRQ